MQDDFNARRNEEMSRLQKTLIEQVRVYAKAQNFDLVIADGVIYTTPTIDITPAILAQLQANPPVREPRLRAVRHAAGRRLQALRPAGKSAVGHPLARRMAVSLGELAVRFGCELRGDPDTLVERVGTLANADSSPSRTCRNRATGASWRQRGPPPSFSDLQRLRMLSDGRADLHQPARHLCAHHDAAASRARRGRRASSFRLVSPTARVDPLAHIGALAVIGDRAVVGPRVYVGPQCVVEEDVTLAEDVRLVASVTLCRGVTIGARTVIQPGAVIGGDGFGFAPEQGKWVKVPQVGSVRIGADVEIGANTTIDRGAIEDTVVEEGVKLDNQIQFGHNVRIGAHTVIAGCTGISGQHDHRQALHHRRSVRHRRPSHDLRST